jgi:hypothetical protein
MESIAIEKFIFRRNAWGVGDSSNFLINIEV